jgi:hypothetical protein
LVVQILGSPFKIQIEGTLSFPLPFFPQIPCPLLLVLTWA